MSKVISTTYHFSLLITLSLPDWMIEMTIDSISKANYATNCHTMTSSIPVLPGRLADRMINLHAASNSNLWTAGINNTADKLTNNMSWRPNFSQQSAGIGMVQQLWLKHNRPPQHRGTDDRSLQHWGTHDRSPQHWGTHDRLQHWGIYDRPPQHWGTHDSPQHWEIHEKLQHWGIYNRPLQHWGTDDRPQH